MAAGRKGNGVGDSSSVARKIKPSGQGYDPGYDPSYGRVGGRRITSVDTFASIAIEKPSKGMAPAYAVGMKRTVTTNAKNYEKGRKEPKGSL